MHSASVEFGCHLAFLYICSCFILDNCFINIHCSFITRRLKCTPIFFMIVKPVTQLRHLKVIRLPLHLKPIRPLRKHFMYKTADVLYQCIDCKYSGKEFGNPVVETWNHSPENRFVIISASAPPRTVVWKNALDKWTICRRLNLCQSFLIDYYYLINNISMVVFYLFVL